MTAATPALPPGPRLPRAVQTLRWIARPMRFMTECRERYGDVFTVKIAQEGIWVLLSDPDHVKQVFTGDPGVFHAGEANEILLPLVGHHSVLLLDDARHMRQRKLLLPPFHGKR
ncbi:MAG: cytochrome family, partial [Solirubrobacteraceae bacterium]|nr:cytochrome family [Solirubrobacteraceae bacterium]